MAHSEMRRQTFPFVRRSAGTNTDHTFLPDGPRDTWQTNRTCDRGNTGRQVRLARTRRARWHRARISGSSVHHPRGFVASFAVLLTWFNSYTTAIRRLCSGPAESHQVLRSAA